MDRGIRISEEREPGLVQWACNGKIHNGQIYDCTGDIGDNHYLTIEDALILHDLDHHGFGKFIVKSGHSYWHIEVTRYCCKICV